MQLSTNTPSALNLFIASIQALETVAMELPDAGGDAMRLASEVADFAFQLTSLIASGAAPHSPQVRTYIFMVAGKLWEAMQESGLRADSRCAKTIKLIQQGA